MDGLFLPLTCIKAFAAAGCTTGQGVKAPADPKAGIEGIPAKAIPNQRPGRVAARIPIALWTDRPQVPHII